MSCLNREAAIFFFYIQDFKKKQSTLYTVARMKAAATREVVSRASSRYKTRKSLSRQPWGGWHESTLGHMAFPNVVENQRTRARGDFEKTHCAFLDA